MNRNICSQFIFSTPQLERRRRNQERVAGCQVLNSFWAITSPTPQIHWPSRVRECMMPIKSSANLMRRTNIEFRKNGNLMLHEGWNYSIECQLGYYSIVASVWLLAACMSISGWIKLNQSQSKSKPAVDRFIIISWSWLLISIHSYIILSASVVLNPTPPPQLQSIFLDPKSFKSRIQEDPLLGNNKRDIGA